MTPRHDYAAILRARHAEYLDQVASMAPVSVTAWRAIRSREDWRERYAIHCAGLPARDARGRDALTGRRWVAVLAGLYLIASICIGATGG